MYISSYTYLYSSLLNSSSLGLGMHRKTTRRKMGKAKVKKNMKSQREKGNGKTFQNTHTLGCLK